MTHAYDSCKNLTMAVYGPNVTNMSYVYRNCTNLTTAVCGPNVTNMAYAYSTCTNLTTAVCGPNVTDMAYAYDGCTNLTTAVCGPNVNNMAYAYRSCKNLTTAVCGPNVTNMSWAYSNCVSLYGNVIFHSNSITNVKGCFNNRSSSLPQLNIFVYKNSITWNTIFKNISSSNSITAQNISWQQQENYYYEPNSNIYLYSIE